MLPPGSIDAFHEVEETTLCAGDDGISTISIRVAEAVQFDGSIITVLIPSCTAENFGSVCSGTWAYTGLNSRSIAKATHV